MIVEFFAPARLHGDLRPSLQHQLDVAIDAGRWTQAGDVLAALIDTWPIAGTVETAWGRWTEAQEPLALAILERARQIMRVTGVQAPALPLPAALPPHLSLAGDTLVAERARLCGLAADGQLAGVLFESPVPATPAAMLALGELRMEAPAQHAVDRYGLPGLLAPDAPAWPDAFGAAPPGRPGPTLELRCDYAVLPGTPERLRRGDPSPVGWLLWNGPAAPVPVAAPVIGLLSTLSEGLEAASRAAGLTPEKGREAILEFIELGALGSANTP